MLTINRTDFQYSRLKVETMSMTLHVLSTEGPSQPLNHYNYAQLDLSSTRPERERRTTHERE